MRIRKVVRYREPGYPEKSALDPREARRIPKRFRSIAAIVAMSAGATALGPFMRGAQHDQLKPGFVVPSHFLTETEVRQILLAEAKRAGLDFSGAKTIEILIPGAGDRKEHTGKYQIRTWDKKRRVGFAFVTNKDAEAAADVSSVAEMALIVKAGVINDHLGGRVRVTAEAPGNEIEDQKQKLRHEMRTFVKWLKSQGVI